MDLKRRSIWISWERQRRSIELSRRLGIRLEIFEYSGLFRYPLSVYDTLRVLSENEYDVVFVQNPSMVLAALVCAIGKIVGWRVVVDRHSTFMLNRSYPNTPGVLLFKLLHKFTIRAADMTIVTNSHLAEITEGLGGSPFILPDPLPELGSASSYSGIAEIPYSVVLVSSFAPDEPIAEAIDAMRGLEQFGIHLFVTGDFKKATGLPDTPDNVHFTGFLSQGDYDGLLLTADAVMVLTRSEHVMLCGCYEAIAAGRPLITSSKNVLKKYFSPAVFVDETAESIRKGILDTKERSPDLTSRVEAFRRQIGEEWARELSHLEEELGCFRSENTGFSGRARR